MSHIVARERRSWTAKEDQLLREAVQKGFAHHPSSTFSFTDHPRQRTQIILIPPNGMLSQSMCQTELTKIVESGGLLKWQTMSSRAVGLPRKMKSWWKASNDMEHGVWSLTSSALLKSHFLLQGGHSSRPWFRQGIVIVSPLHQLLNTIPDLFTTECAKRWTDTLNPAIDRTTWTPEAVRFCQLPHLRF